MHMTRTLTQISKACGSALAALLLIAAPAADASFSVDVRTSGTVPDLPDPAGRAGMVAGTVTEDDGSQSVIAAGGANFPRLRRAPQLRRNAAPKPTTRIFSSFATASGARREHCPSRWVTPPLPAWARGWLWPEATMLRAS